MGKRAPKLEFLFPGFALESPIKIDKLQFPIVNNNDDSGSKFDTKKINNLIKT